MPPCYRPVPVVRDGQALKHRSADDSDGPSDGEETERPGAEVVGAEGEDAVVETQDGKFDGKDGEAPGGFEDELELCWFRVSGGARRWRVGLEGRKEVPCCRL